MGYFWFPTRNLKSHPQKYKHHILHHKLFFFPKKQQQQLPLMFVFLHVHLTQNTTCVFHFWWVAFVVGCVVLLRRRSWEDCEDVATASMDSVTSLVDQAWSHSETPPGRMTVDTLGLLVCHTPTPTPSQPPPKKGHICRNLL